MAAAGAFGVDLAGKPVDLTYWHISGGYTPGQARALFRGKAEKLEDTTQAAAAGLLALIAAFDDPARAYLSQPHPGAAPRFSDYTQLARVAEWAAADD